MLKCTVRYFKMVIFSFLFITIYPTAVYADAPKKCVQIYYDAVNSTYYEGHAVALALENLLGHFSTIQRYMIPIETYKQGQLERCYASFYLGTYYDNAIPNTFYTDFVKTKKNVIWMQYNIWKLNPKILQSLWSVKYNGLSNLDWQHLDAKGQPGFYRYYQYKGQVFPAYGDFDPTNSKKFLANSEIAQMSPLDPKANQNVVSWVKHSVNNQLTPFILRNGNHWYMAQTPFQYSTRESQYMIFADVLFDMVGEEALYKGKRPALVRIEDVNVGFDTPDQITEITDLFYKMKMPFSIAIIPIFADPLGVLKTKKEGPITHSYAFVHALHYAQDHGASFIFEGVTHQYNKMKNPYNGMTGPDYEFWDMVHDRPIKEDSPMYMLNKLQMGADAIAAAGFKPTTWLSPHYRSSILDYVMYAQLFDWVVEAKYYVPYKAEQKELLPVKLNFNNDWPGSVAKRAPYFSTLKVSYSPQAPLDAQFFPYEIYGDVYGQRALPENAGYITPAPNAIVKDNETVDDMIRIIKRDSVLRDVWASFFIHPVLLNSVNDGGLAKYPGDTSEIERLLRAIDAAGYQFIDLDSWTKQHMEMAPPTKETSYP